MLLVHIAMGCVAQGVFMTINATQMSVRDAVEADLSALVMVRPSEVVHRGRLHDAQQADFRYFVLELGQDIIGFACLVFRRPSTWSDPDDKQYLPQIVDFYIAEEQRGKGYGSQTIRIMEHIAAEAGHQHLYVAVESLDNPRAYALYQRLGYQPLQSEPVLHHWSSLDGDGNVHRGNARLVFMVKSLISP